MIDHEFVTLNFKDTATSALIVNRVIIFDSSSFTSLLFSVLSSTNYSASYSTNSGKITGSGCSSDNLGGSPRYDHSFCMTDAVLRALPVKMVGRE
jgi:hypothetical protein